MRELSIAIPQPVDVAQLAKKGIVKAICAVASVFEATAENLYDLADKIDNLGVEKKEKPKSRRAPKKVIDAQAN